MHYWFLFKVAVNCLNDILLLVRITALRGTWRIFGISILVIGLRVEVRWTQTTTLGWDLFFLGAILVQLHHYFDLYNNFFVHVFTIFNRNFACCWSACFWQPAQLPTDKILMADWPSL